MNIKFNTLQQVINVFGIDEALKPSEIALRLDKNRDTVHKYLKVLVAQGKIKKEGKTPHVRYSLTKSNLNNIKKKVDVDFSYQQTQLLDQNFLKYDARGAILQWVDGFVNWCIERDLDPYKKYDSYESVIKYISSSYNNCGLLDAIDIFKKQVDHLYLDKIFYADQYRLMEFGRSKLAELTFCAKQSQDYKLIQSSIDLYIRKIECLIKTEKIDALAFTPASITRRYQLLDILDKRLSDINLPRVGVVKYYPTKVIIPQKSLKTRAERIKNAQQTIFVYDDSVSKYKKVLLIDDFVGSGSTLNETAKKLKDEWVKIVIGFAIVGNMDLSYDVINEV